MSQEQIKNEWDILPEKFLLRLHEFLPENTFEEVVNSFTFRKPSTFRANALKISADELKNQLEKLGIKTKPVSWYKDAFILDNVPQRVLTETDFYKHGFFYVQSLSSMIPPLVLDPKPDEKILDLCAAPGSKTTQIAAIIQNKGEILANDKSHVRNFKLKANLEVQGVKNTHVSQIPGELLWKKFPEFFDKALVDVPCSMEGRFYTKDEKTFRDWTSNKVKVLSNTQKFLLRSAISATRPGGVIIYSTCTLSPEENEEVIDWILKKENDSIQIDEIKIPGLPLSPGITNFKQKVFNPEVKKAARIYPTNTMEGFFITKIRKLKPTVNNIRSY